MSEYNYIYILRAEGDRLYTGYTTDPVRRLKEHMSGTVRASRFTRAFAPRTMAACWGLSCSRGEALKIEAGIKKLSKPAKRRLLSDDEAFRRLVTRYCGREVAFWREESENIEQAVLGIQGNAE